MMKLGQQTGSFVNHLMSQSKPVKPEIGMGATFLSWTDRNPGTVVSYDPKKKIVGITYDNAVRTDNYGMSEYQEYEFTSVPDGYVHYFKKDKIGNWVGISWNKDTKRWNKNHKRVIIGIRDKYHDFSF